MKTNDGPTMATKDDAGDSAMEAADRILKALEALIDARAMALASRRQLPLVLYRGWPEPEERASEDAQLEAAARAVRDAIAEAL